MSIKKDTTIYETKKLDNLFKIVDKLVAIRNKTYMQPQVENEYNYILSELQAYNRCVNYIEVKENFKKLVN
tara:strand:- start:706 stop:918 length:213 start_codon:yes stop_codon:yes gene_type:complete